MAAKTSNRLFGGSSELLSSADFRHLRDLVEFGLFADSGKFERFREVQGNSAEFSRISYALNMNSVGIPGGFRRNARFSGNFGVWGGFGRFGASKGFCANRHYYFQEKIAAYAFTAYHSHQNVYQIKFPKHFFRSCNPLHDKKTNVQIIFQIM